MIVKRKRMFSIHEFDLKKNITSSKPYDEKSLTILKKIAKLKKVGYFTIFFFVLYTHILILNKCRLHIYQNRFDWILLSNFINIFKKLHTVQCVVDNNITLTFTLPPQLIYFR